MSAAAAAAPADSIVSSDSVPAASLPGVDSLSSFSTPHFHSLQWRLDVQRFAREAGDMDKPTAIVQIQTKQTLPRLRTAAEQADAATPAATNTQQLQFEMDRATAAHVLLEFEKIEAIMAGAQ